MYFHMQSNLQFQYLMSLRLKFWVAYVLCVCLCLYVGLGKEKDHGWIKLLDRETANEIFKQHRPAVMLLLEDGDEQSPVFEVFSQLANMMPKLLFTYSKKTQDVYTKLLELLGTNKLNSSHILYFRQNAQKYLLDLSKQEGLTLERIRRFIQDAENQKIQEYLRAQESTEYLPQQQLEDMRKYVTYFDSYTLRDTLRNSKKEFLIILYAPWCPHSRELSPQLKKLAKMISNNENMVIGKMDASVNEIRGYEPTGYPTILWYGKDKTVPPTFYYGPRDAQQLLIWLRKMTIYPWVQQNTADQKEIIQQTLDNITEIFREVENDQL